MEDNNEKITNSDLLCCIIRWILVYILIKISPFSALQVIGFYFCAAFAVSCIEAEDEEESQ